jgi:GR25 family glycosyltransferase involved in LPS biosynthesis
MARPTAAFPTFIINLDSDEQRRQKMFSQLSDQKTFDVYIIDAIPGRIIPESARRVLAQDASWASHKGTMGCFLSHVKAWEAVATAASPFGVVLEDDVDVTALADLKDIDLPQDAEIIFLNDRMSPEEKHEGPAKVIPLWNALRKLDKLKSGAGGDGYLLTSIGAKTLVSACLKDFYFGHVDGRLLRYAASQSDLEMAGENSWIANIIERHHHSRLVPKLGLLRGYCLSKPIVRHMGLDSTREAVDTPNVIDSPARVALRNDGHRDEEANFVPIRYWDRVANIGDLINPFIIESVSGRQTYFSSEEKREHVLGIGSIFFMANRSSHIWGSGIMDPTRDYSNVDPSKVHAVRGRKTRDILFRDYGLKQDVPLGDPGILAPDLPELATALRDVKNKRRVGIIPHYTMVGNSVFADLAKLLDGEILSTRSFDLDLIAEIAASEIIISQSLHGLIFAEALGIPSAWVTHTPDDIWSFKFWDWYTNTLEPPKAPMLLGNSSPQEMRQAARLSGLNIDKKSICSAFPQIKAPLEARPDIGFRQTRGRPPYVYVITAPDELLQSPHRYDRRLVCRLGDDESLRIKLNEQARRFEEPPNIVLVFAAAFYLELSNAFVDRLADLLTEFPDVHFISVLESKQFNAKFTEPVLSKSGLKLHKFHESFAWRGAVFARHSVNFSFSAPAFMVSPSP